MQKLDWIVHDIGSLLDVHRNYMYSAEEKLQDARDFQELDDCYSESDPRHAKFRQRAITAKVKGSRGVPRS